MTLQAAATSQQRRVQANAPANWLRLTTAADTESRRVLARGAGGGVCNASLSCSHWPHSMQCGERSM